MKKLLQMITAGGRVYVTIYSLTAATLIQCEIILHAWIGAGLVFVTWLLLFPRTRAIWRISRPLR